MKTDAVKSNWVEVRGKIKSKWSKLSDHEIDSLKDNLDHLSGKLEKAYGHTKEIAEKESSEFRSSLT